MPLRLLCDEMLTGLARWLRAAGHDAALAEPGADDASLLRRATREDRLFLTRDRGVGLHRAAAGRAVVVENEDLDAQAAELRRRLCVDWLAAPFSRCLDCNVLLQDASADDIATLPQPAQNRPGPWTRCPSCGRVYWPGSHVRRMRERLERWAAGGIPSGP